MTFIGLHYKLINVFMGSYVFTNIKKKKSMSPHLTHWTSRSSGGMTSVSDIRAASQVGVVDGIGEVQSQLDALGGKRAEDVFADSSGEHGQGVCRRQSNQILLGLPLFHVIRKQLCTLCLLTQ